MQEIHSKYTGKYLALVDEEIVAVGNSTLEVYKSAKKLHPQKLITLMYAPTKKEATDYFISSFELS